MPFKTDYNPVEYQTPCPIIEIYLPNNKSTSEPDYTFRADIAAGALSNLQGYNFTESTDDLEGSFSFSVKNGEINGKSLFDLFPIRSVVKIYEGADRPSFVGIIRHRKINKQMTNAGLKESVTFSGKSITSCVAEYMVSLDKRIYTVGDAQSKNIDLVNNLSKIDKIEDFIKITWEHFQDVSLSLNKKLNKNGITNIKIAEVIKNFMGENFFVVEGKEQSIKYNIATVFYNEANNNIADIWRNILPKGLYELFYRCETGQPQIIIRQVPFGDPKNNCEDWKNLKLYKINPGLLLSYELDQNDDEVYTAFASSVIGSAREPQFYINLNAAETDETVKYCASKVAVYGFRPFTISFMGYDRSHDIENKNINKLTEIITNLNELVAYWYSRNDEMFSGTITVITNFKDPAVNPRIGCRAGFLGGEFYINKTDHTWNYGGTPTIKLSVSRGMVYSKNGEMEKAIENVGGKYRELDDVVVA